jgi:transposase
MLASRRKEPPPSTHGFNRLRDIAITKAGDAYLRSLLVLGARAVLNAAANKTDSLSRWAMQFRQRRGYWKAVVAIAAKNARMAWAVLTKGESFKLPA